MGIRITAYLIDRPRFSHLLDMSLGELVLMYVENADPAHRSVFLYDESGDQSFHAITTRGVIQSSHVNPVDPQYREMTPEDVRSDPFLCQRTGDHIRASDSIVLQGILSGLAACKNSDVVRIVSEGHRRWWIGSVVEAARSEFGVVDPDCLLLEELLGRMVRNYSCGTHVRASQFELASIPQEFRPAQDAENAISVWRATEVERAMRAFKRLLSSEARFPLPDRPYHPTQDEAETSVERIRERCRQFAEVKLSRCVLPNLISFIS